MPSGAVSFYVVHRSCQEGGHTEKDKLQGRGITLNALKDELHSLNRRMLLAIQTHDEAEQAQITREITAVQKKISGISFRDSSFR